MARSSVCRFLFALAMLVLLGCVLTGVESSRDARVGAGVMRLKHSTQVSAVAFSHDGKILASGGEDDPLIQLWNAETGRTVSRLKGHSSGVWSLAFSPDGNILASGGGRTLRLWDTGTRTQFFIHGYYGNAVPSLSFSADGKLLAMASGWSLSLWDVASGREMKRIERIAGRDRVLSVAFSPKRNLLAAGIRIRSVVGRGGPPDEKRVILQELPGDKSTSFGDERLGAKHLAFSPDGRLLATVDDDNSIRLWDVATCKMVKELPDGKPLFGIINGPVVFSPDGRLLAGVTGADKGTGISLWEVATGKKALVLRGHRGTVLSLAFSPDGKKLASGGQDKVAIIWDLQKMLRREAAR